MSAQRTDSLSLALARYIVGLDAYEVPQHVVEFAKLCILDWLGSAIGGARQPPTLMLHRTVDALGGAQQATTVTGLRTSMTNAALVNGAAGHVIELDDIHKASIIHAGTVVIPAALAVAERTGASGRQLIAAIVAGYEVCYRIGEAVSPSHYYYWHNTATCGTFGAAAAAAKLLGLDERQTAHALGSAGTQAAGLWEFIEDGAMSKQLHPGKAAMNGVLSALIAGEGFTSATRILEGKRAFFSAMSERADAERITDRLGSMYKITENSFKIHASCRHTHSAIDIVLDIVRAIGGCPAVADIESIVVQTYRTALDITDNADPDSVYAAKFSLQYCVALAVLRGKADLGSFSEAALRDDAIRALMRKVRVEVDPAIDAAYPREWGARVSIAFADGSSEERTATFPCGDPENPVTADELRRKFADIALYAGMEQERCERWIAQVDALDGAPTITAFFEEGGALR